MVAGRVDPADFHRIVQNCNKEGMDVLRKGQYKQGATQKFGRASVASRNDGPVVVPAPHSVSGYLEPWSATSTTENKSPIFEPDVPLDCGQCFSDFSAVICIEVILCSGIK